MSTNRPNMRLSDAERQDAMDVLGEHVSTGRIDIDEFGTRSAKISAAKTVGELAPLFEDLPSPRPMALIARPGTEAPEPQRSTGQPPFRWLSASALPVVVLVAVALFVVTRSPLTILLIPVAVMLLANRRR